MSPATARGILACVARLGQPTPPVDVAALQAVAAQATAPGPTHPREIWRERLLRALIHPWHESPHYHQRQPERRAAMISDVRR